MELWWKWWEVVRLLRPACARRRTFLWLAAALAGVTVRPDLFGVTSIVRALGLRPRFYDRLLDVFHSSALSLSKLTPLWVSVVMGLGSSLVRVNGRPVLVGDGLKTRKSGKKMPAVKKLHVTSSNQPRTIWGHSCQAVAILVGSLGGCFALPLACRIHEGLVFSNRDHRTLLDKMIALLESLGIRQEFYFVADAYYASRRMALPLLEKGHHLVSRVRSNAVAYLPAKPPSGRRPVGRPRFYGKKVPLRFLFECSEAFTTIESPVYGEKRVALRIASYDLLWRPVGRLVRFVLVTHPVRGKIILMSTDLTLSATEVLRLYGLRFKIEVSFKQSLRTLGAYAYHFWMRTMKPRKNRSGNQYLHRESQAYRESVRRTLAAYHRHIQIGLIAQGLVQYLSVRYPRLVWSHYGSWIRTIRPGRAPSEYVTAMALRNMLPEFLADDSEEAILAKFLPERVDVTRTEGARLIGEAEGR